MVLVINIEKNLNHDEINNDSNEYIINDSKKKKNISNEIMINDKTA